MALIGNDISIWLLSGSSFFCAKGFFDIKIFNKYPSRKTLKSGVYAMTIMDILIVGIVANLVTDAYEWVLERTLDKTRDWHLVGRWVANMFSGSFILDTEDETQAVSGELALGWVFHYVVGIAYAAFYLFAVQYFLNEPPSFVTAIGFGVVTVAAPWFILMPGLGVGMFAANAGRPTFVRVASLSVHAVFGIGIYLGTIVAGLA